MTTSILVGFAVLLLPLALGALRRAVATGKSRARPVTITGAIAIDGDTLSHPKGRIRVAGIDAPELAQDGGLAARQALAEIVAGVPVIVHPIEIDRYARLVARLEVGGYDVAGLLVERGFARADRDEPRYQALEAQARAARRGLWSTRAGIGDPAAFRRTNA